MNPFKPEMTPQEVEAAHRFLNTPSNFKDAQEQWETRMAYVSARVAEFRKETK